MISAQATSNSIDSLNATSGPAPLGTGTYGVLGHRFIGSEDPKLLCSGLKSHDAALGTVYLDPVIIGESLGADLSSKHRRDSIFASDDCSVGEGTAGVRNDG